MGSRRLWISMLTRNTEESGTDSAVRLTITVRGIDVVDRLLSSEDQADQSRAEANIYSLDLKRNQPNVADLDDNSFRIGVRGDDAWRPEHIFLWLEEKSFFTFRRTVVPLAMEMDIQSTLSTDANEGAASLPLRLIGSGDRSMVVRRILILPLTHGDADTGPFIIGNPVFGTKDPLRVQIRSKDGTVRTFRIAGTSQTDLTTGWANFYTAIVDSPFARADLDRNAITLTVEGKDSWQPEGLFIFGLNETAGRPSLAIPLVHVPKWNLGFLKEDATTGAIPTVQLPLS